MCSTRLAFPGCNETNGFSFDNNKWEPDGSYAKQNPWWHKAGTKEDLMKIGMSTGEPSDLFFCEDVDFPWLFRDDFHWFAKWSEKYPFPQNTRSIDLTDLMKSTKRTLCPYSIPPALEEIERMTWFIVEDDISLSITPWFDFGSFTESEERCKKVFAEHFIGIVDRDSG